MKPWSAAWNRSASVPKAGGPPAMNDPAPGRIWTTPITASDRRPARRLGRLTPSCRASSRSDGQAVARLEFAPVQEAAHVRHDEFRRHRTLILSHGAMMPVRSDQ